MAGSLTAVERVLILKGAGLLRDVGPRHLLRLAEVAREIEVTDGDTVYREEDPAEIFAAVVPPGVVAAAADAVPPRP